VKAGIRDGDPSSGWGLVFGSSRDLKCSYSHDHGSIEHYTGHICKCGVDIGRQAADVIAWTVIAPTNDVGNVGVGVGTDVLADGFKGSVASQPLRTLGSVQSSAADDVALSIWSGHRCAAVI
jgi:hypothetical protein